MQYYAPPIDIKRGLVEMNHGSGGLAMSRLITDIFQKHFGNDVLASGDDFAHITLTGKCAMSTDSFVISPLFFPGGDIGSLAVHGTVNDVAMSGARPLYLSVSFILEEGLPLADLDRIAKSMGLAAIKAGVKIVTGDTKVVERGKGDGVFINTTGIGLLERNIDLSGANAKPGHKIIVSGSMGDHGVAIMAHRENIQFTTGIESDSASLAGLIDSMLEYTDAIHCLRDPTRGGLATTLNEIATQSHVGIHLVEQAIPVKSEVKGACELLGLDPLYVANEGKLVCICESKVAEELVLLMREYEFGKHAAIIGEVRAEDPGLVQMQTGLGGSRVVDWLVGESLPRIC